MGKASNSAPEHYWIFVCNSRCSDRCQSEERLQIGRPCARVHLLLCRSRNQGPLAGSATGQAKATTAKSGRAAIGHADVDGGEGVNGTRIDEMMIDD